MRKDITKIKMSGANFESLTTFDFFNPYDKDKVKTVKGTLLYGRNGTGKRVRVQLQGHSEALPGKLFQS